MENERESNFVIFASILDGQTYAEVGDRNGISGARVSQIVAKVRRQLLRIHPDRPFSLYDSSPKELRENKAFWLALIAKAQQG